MDLTLDEQRALALANARKRAAEAQAGLKPWERDWSKPQSGSRQQVLADFEALPWYGQAGQAAMDIARLGADGATFGFADKLAAGIDAALTDCTYDRSLAHARELTEEARLRSGRAGDIADIGGSMITMGGASKVRLGLIDSAQGLGKLLAGGIEGAGYGALDALGHDQDLATGAVTGAAGGAAGTAIAQAAGALGRSAGGAFKRRPQVPSTEELRGMAQRAYRTADEAGVMIARPSLERMHSELVHDLTEFGFHPKIQRNTAAALSEINRIAKGHATLKGLDTARRIAIKGFGAGKSDNEALGMVIRHIDRLIDTLGKGDVVMGDPATGAAALRQARDLWRRMEGGHGRDAAGEGRQPAGPRAGHAHDDQQAAGEDQPDG